MQAEWIQPDGDFCIIHSTTAFTAQRIKNVMNYLLLIMTIKEQGRKY